MLDREDGPAEERKMTRDLIWRNLEVLWGGPREEVSGEYGFLDTAPHSVIRIPDAFKCTVIHVQNSCSGVGVAWCSLIHRDAGQGRVEETNAERLGMDGRNKWKSRKVSPAPVLKGK